MAGEQLEHEISKTRSLTDKSFGVNIFTLPSRQFEISTQAIDLVRTQSSTFGYLAKDIVNKCKQLSISLIETAKQAVLFKEKSLLSQTAQFIDPTLCPLVAAGEIMDEYGLVNALMFGASGAQMGTRFLASHEGPKLVRKAHRKSLLEVNNDIKKLSHTTAITDYFHNTKDYQKLILLISKYIAVMKQVDFAQLWARQNYARCESQSAATIVN
ncbi:unnamed protein product [Adineta ricciae]|nr:unnamed protein product [Adineta ricciae]